MSEDPFFFVPENPEWNALIGDQGESIFYAEGYIEAALELAQLIVRGNRFAQRDTLIMPILYNARHSIELHLKLFIRELLEAGLVSSAHPINHDLASHFSHLSDTELGDFHFRNSLKQLKPFVTSLSRIDDDGQEFRYFETKEGDRSLEGKTLANIVVVGRSLEQLKDVLNDLKYRTWSLCNEYKTGTYTDKLSRSDLFEIAKMLPQRTDWDSPEFDDARNAAKKKFNIGNRQFSIALDKMQETRELNSVLGTESPLVYLTDEKALFLAKQWRIIHPVREMDRGFFDTIDPAQLTEVFANSKQETAARKSIQSGLSIEELADAKTVFYLARNKEFSEFYEVLVEENLKGIQVRDDIRQDVYDLMSKTNFLKMFTCGVRKLGRLQLYKKLLEI